MKFILRNQFYGNNSVVAVTDIGENDEALLCYTNSTACCRNNLRETNSTREWHFPNGSVVGMNDNGDDFYGNRGPSVVRLNRRNNALMPTGVFRCEVPDANGSSQSLYVGIYPSGLGMPKIDEIVEYSYDLNQILTCTSVGGPASTVKWWKNGEVLDNIYDQQKRIIDLKISKYLNILFLGQLGPDDIVGNYSCLVKNSRGMDSKTIQLHGEFNDCLVLLAHKSAVPTLLQLEFRFEDD